MKVVTKVEDMKSLFESDIAPHLQTLFITKYHKKDMQEIIDECNLYWKFIENSNIVEINMAKFCKHFE